MLCSASIVTAAIFVALIFFDLFRHEYKSIPGTSLAAFFFVLLTEVICEAGYQPFAWLIMSIPFIILITAYYAQLAEAPGPIPYPVEPEVPCAPYYM
jgi:hypothetical protein